MVGVILNDCNRIVTAVFDYQIGYRFTLVVSNFKQNPSTLFYVFRSFL